MKQTKKFLVVGGGLGGMAAAIALSRQGWAVDLVETDPDWRVLGAGLTVLGSTLRALAGLGVLPEVMEAGYFSYGNDIHRYTGEHLFQRPGMVLADMDLPGSGGILRPVLHRILSQVVLSSGVNVRLGISPLSVASDAGGTDVQFDDESQGRYDLVVAAEGLMSATRQKLFPDAPVPEFTGQGCWRLVVDRPAEVERSRFYIGGPVTVGVVPVSRDQMYVWVLEHVPDNPWRDPATQHEVLRELLCDFGGTVGEIRDAIGPASTIVYRPLEAILVPSPWHSGRVVLIGDAAHATTPHLASGAGMAIEDGIVLADELARNATIDDALAAFMTRRFERCRLVVDSSLAIGRVEMEHQPSQNMVTIMNEAQAELARPF